MDEHERPRPDEAQLQAQRAGAQSPLAGQLRRCAATCEQAIGAYLDRPEADRNTVGQALVAAAAAMETVAAHDKGGDPRRVAALDIAAGLSRSAADTCRRHGLDQILLHAAAACDHAATLCENTHY